MQSRPLRFLCCAGLAVALFGGPPAAQTRLELGKMWTFDRPPLAYLEAEYGFSPDGAWLDAFWLYIRRPVVLPKN